MQKITYLLLAFILSALSANAQLIQMSEQESEPTMPGPLVLSRAATDTIMLGAFNSLPGAATVLGYNYTNGTGYFFGTNFLDLDQDPNTPHQYGAQAVAQGFIIDSLNPYHIDAILLRVGLKVKNSPFGTPLIVSLQLADGESSYSINSAGTPISYTIKAPGTGLAQVSFPYDSIKAGFGTWYSRVNLPAPVLVNRNYFVVLDFADYYLNDDKLGMYASSSGGASQIFGKENVLWLYPSPFLWLQVSHIYGNVDRCIAIFPIIDDGTSGTECIGVVNGIRDAMSYPNPCSEDIAIKFGIDKPSDAAIALVDQNGRTIEEVVLRNLPAGNIEHKFNISGLAAGLYFYTIETNQGNLARKFIKSN